MASLLSLPGNTVVVLTLRESKTGGDSDLVVVNPTSSTSVQFYIQEKRLTPHHRDWMIGSYVELAHPHNSGGQSKTLIRSIGRERLQTIPVYAFYNPAHICTASDGLVTGLELASGRAIGERVKAFIRKKPKRLPFKRIGSLQPLFFPISTMLCAPSSAAGSWNMPSPEDARAAVIAAIEGRSDTSHFGRGMTLPAGAASLLPRSDDRKAEERSGKTSTSGTIAELPVKLPAVIRSAVERREERIIIGSVKRPKIILLAD